MFTPLRYTSTSAASAPLHDRPMRPHRNSTDTDAESWMGGSTPFDTTTVTPDDIVCPALSVAAAASIYVPSGRVVESHCADQPSAPSVSTPTLAPSAKNSTCTTPLSSPASAVIVTVPETVSPQPGLTMCTAGGLSGMLFWTVTPAVLSAVWPAVSVARAVSRWAASGTVVVSHSIAQPSAPSTSTPMLAPSTRNSTCVTPASSLASAVRVTTPDTRLPSTGAVSATVGSASAGGTGSGGAGGSGVPGGGAGSPGS